jgi:hypothetical protein
MPVIALVRHDKGDDFHEEASSIIGRGAGSPEHRWLRAVLRQGQSPASGRYEGLGKRDQADRPLCPGPFTGFGARPPNADL